MWTYLIRIILRNRFLNLIIIGLLTAFFAYYALDIKLSYEMMKMLPDNNQTSAEYKQFKETFGQDGSIFFIAIRDKEMFELEKFNAFYDLGKKIDSIDGVEGILSVANTYNLTKNDNLKKFDFDKIIKAKPKTQNELDSLKNVIFSLPFYQNLLYNKSTDVYLMAITLDKLRLNTKSREELVHNLKNTVEEFSIKNKVEVHYSGLPYIRTITSEKVRHELIFFIIGAILVSAIILLIFFRSIKTVFFTIVIIIINVVWVFGLTSLLDYKITILTGILPPLLIIIVVENCIFLLNKYHEEYKNHGNKIKSLSRMVRRIGNANLLTNATTAAGFAAFTITGNKMLVEFGVIASICILSAYFLTLFLIPIFFSYLGNPKEKHLNKIEKGFAKKIIIKVIYIVGNYRNIIYVITVICVILAIIGITKLKTTGNVVDDIPANDPLYIDLMFLEKNFKGVMPFEISIDTKKKNGVLKLSTINRIEQLQKVLAEYPEFSEPLSVAEVVKYAKQAFYNGDPEMYSIPNNQEKNFILSYLPNLENNNKSILNSFVDTNMQTTRISIQMANIGTNEIERIKNELKPKINKIFPPSKFDVKITGTSVVFLEGTNYLVKNLMTSLLLALFIISLFMILLFTSGRMILISLIPNLIPQLMTAGMMGFFGIPIKPSTILIFSIALGISVDNAIHFLSRYRLHLKLNKWNIKKSVYDALGETGYSMIYSSIVLFFGFIIFTFSSFGGTVALGYLIAFTLVIALLSNLFILPSLLLSLDKWSTTKNFKEPFLEIFDEEEDIEINSLEVDTRGSA